jgi:hypothetical protein
VSGSAWLRAARACIQFTTERGGLEEESKHVLADAALDGLADVLEKTVDGFGVGQLALVAGELDMRELILTETIALLLACGFLKASGGKLQTTKAARLTLADGKAGALYRALFLTYVRDLNLVAAYNAPDTFETLESTLPYVLYRLQAETETWRKASWLWDKVLHPDTLDLFPAMKGTSRVMRSTPLAVLVLQPLVQLNLLEGRAAPRAREPEFRQTPFFRRVLTFDWSPERLVPPPLRSRRR